MNVQAQPPAVTGVTPPPQPKTLADTGLSLVMMREILLKTMFRMNISLVSDLSRAICLPVPLTQELVDITRSQKMLEATGTLHATSGNEMGYQLTDAGKARALDALSQSEYYGALPVPLEAYGQQMKRQSVRDIKLTRPELLKGMGHLILPEDLIDNLGPAVTSGRSILMYGPPGNGKSSISNGIRAALGDKIYVPRAIEYSGQVDQVLRQRHRQADRARDFRHQRQVGAEHRLQEDVAHHHRVDAHIRQIARTGRRLDAGLRGLCCRIDLHVHRLPLLSGPLATD